MFLLPLRYYVLTTPLNLCSYKNHSVDMNIDDIERRITKNINGFKMNCSNIYSHLIFRHFQELDGMDGQRK